MNFRDSVKLIFLSAIWGGSFIFMRILSPKIGPLVTADLRVLIAGSTLLVYYRRIGIKIDILRDFKHFLFISTVNAVVPFSMFSFAALYLPAGYSSILNSTSPFFSALFASFMLGTVLTAKHFLGFFIGAAGVTVMTHPGNGGMNRLSLLALACCLVASACYGLAGAYIKKFANHIGSEDLAAKSQFYAGVILLPALFIFPPTIKNIDFTVVGSLLALALLSSGLAYVLYFPLLKIYGATKALTVTYLMPIFGVTWAILFLHEKFELRMLTGGALVLFGTLLVMAAPPVERSNI